MAVGKKLRWEIFRRDNFACRYCGRSINDGAILEVDHVNPRSRRGADVPTNLVTACDACNSGKSDTPIGAPPIADVPQEIFRRACAERGVAPPDPEDLDSDGLPAGLANRILFFLMPEERELLVEEELHWHVDDDEDDEDEDAQAEQADLTNPDGRERLAFRAFTEERSDRQRLSVALQQLVWHLPKEQIQLFEEASQDFVQRRAENETPPPRDSLVLAVAIEDLVKRLNEELWQGLPREAQAEWLEYAEALWPDRFNCVWVSEDYKPTCAAEIVAATRADRHYLSMCSFSGDHIEHCPRRAEHRLFIEGCEHCVTDGVEYGHPACKSHLETFRAGRMKRRGDGIVVSLRDVQPFSDGQKELA